MVFCSRCGKELPENAYFCPICGVRTEKGTAVSAPLPYRDMLSDIGKDTEKTLAKALEETKKALDKAKEELDKVREDFGKSISRESIACPSCGEKNPVHAKFCRKCGKKLS
jgi:ribosomal protein L40E